MNTIHNNMTALSEENLDKVQGGFLFTATLVAGFLAGCGGLTYMIVKGLSNSGEEKQQ